MISILGVLCALIGSAYAAPVLVWSAAEGNGKTIHPYGDWYTFKYSEEGTSAAKVSFKETDEANVITATVGKTISSSAGVGFGWAKDEGEKDLRDYQGVCLTYAADTIFRLDFKQTNVKDANYNGYDVPPKASIDTLFIPFSELAQEKGWGTARELDLQHQTGMQFSYKQSYLDPKKPGMTTNVIKIAAIHFGSSCGNHAPNLKDGVESPKDTKLNEGDTLVVAFKDIFEDADGDDLNITMSMASDAPVIDLKGAKSYSMSDVALLKSKPNPKTGTIETVVFTASDPDGKSVKYTLALELVDQDNAPVAVDDAYEVDEDTKLTVSTAKGVLKNDYDDDDDPENPTFVATLGETTTHGVLVFNGSGFTYTPEADFYGEDSFTYFVTDGDGNKSNTATVTITVKNVDDPATFVINHPFFYVGSLAEDPVNFEDGVTVQEDFEDFDIFIPDENITFSDPDVQTSSFPLQVASVNGRVVVVYSKVSGSYAISVSAVPDANDEDIIKLFLLDGKDSVGIDIPIKITGTPDKPVAKNDTYDVVQDSVNTVSAKLGVLANDVNPDGESVLKAYLFEGADHGTVKLATDGSFTYDVGDYEGKDIFTYFVVNAEGDTSEVASVTLTVKYRNHAPVLAEGVKDTVGKRLATLKEDFAASVVFKATEVETWFEDPEGDAITISAVNADSMLKVVASANGAITVKSVENACGETTIDVIATDAKKNSTTLTILATIACLNDAPERLGNVTDTVLVPRDGWREVFYIYDVFKDVDDSVLTLKVTSINKFLHAEIEGDSLIVTLTEERLALQDKVAYELRVSVADAAGLTALKKFIFMVGDKTAIPQVAAAPKASWQNAILANQGVAAMCDMQGRVMWKAKLPVSEADVRNAAAQVQGRKVLMVNKQTWTIR